MSESHGGRASPKQDLFKSRLWLVPVASLLGASFLAILTTWVDRRLFRASLLDELFSRNPDAIRTALSVVASSILTFTALVFTITMVVVQQASNQLSPRVVRTFLEDRMSQITLGVFMGTFAYALLVLRDVRSPVDGQPFVPGLSVALVFVAVFASLTVFVSYLNHITSSLQMSTVLSMIAGETSSAIERLYPAERADSDPPLPDSDQFAAIPWTENAGVLRRVDGEALADLAAQAGSVVRISRQIGDFVPRGSDILLVSGEVENLDRQAALDTLTIGLERDVSHDVAFGLRQLVDIAERALSPGINDPTTAVQVIDQLHELLRNLSWRDLESVKTVQRSGEVRVVVPGPHWDDFVRMAIEELRHYGADSIQVIRRLREMLDDLSQMVPEDRRKPVLAQRALLDAAAEESFRRDGFRGSGD